jgi:hypothetical protein
VDDKEFNLVLEALVNYNLVERASEGEYVIAEPHLKEMDFDKL